MNQLVKKERKLSPFQLALLNGVESGAISEEVVNRIKKEGSEIVRVATSKYFSMASNDGYVSAVRMVDTLISLALVTTHFRSTTTFDKNHSVVLCEKSLEDLVGAGFKFLKSLDSLPENPIFESKVAYKDLSKVSDLQNEVKRNKFVVDEFISKVLNDKKVRTEYLESLEIVRFAIKVKCNGNPDAMEAEVKFLESTGAEIESVVNSFIFSLIFDIPNGYDLKVSKVKEICDLWRPSEEIARSRIRTCMEKFLTDPKFIAISGNFNIAVGRFFRDPVIKRFFKNVVDFKDSSLYRAPRGSKIWRIVLYTNNSCF